MDFQTAAENWLAYRAKLVALGRLQASTHRNHGKIARIWIDELGEVELTKLRKSNIELALGALAATRQPVTQAADMKLLAQILNWCVDEGYLAERPRLPTVTVPNVELELPSDAAFVWALKSVPPQHQASLEFMLLTGLAPHECERLRPEDYDKERQSIGIGMRDDFKVKTPSRRRWVPLNAKAAALWPFVPFPTVGATEKALQRARSDDMPKGAEQITPKMMRKWFSSKLAKECAEHVLQRLLGHAPGSKVTRKHYVRSSQSDVEGAVMGHSTPQGG